MCFVSAVATAAVLVATSLGAGYALGLRAGRKSTHKQTHESGAPAAEQEPQAHDESSDSEMEEEDLADAISPIYDQLSLAWFWWILEFFPIRIRYQHGDNSWANYLGWNLGRGRVIPKQKTQGVKVHRSVKMRMEATYENGGRYVPKASFDERYTTWVD